MKLASVIILIGFLALSLFGFAGMLESSGMAHEGSPCLASLAQNGECPPPEHTLASALFHTDAFKVFSTTLVSVLPVLFIGVFFAVSAGPVATPLPSGVRTFFARIGELVSRYRALRNLRFALARMEHSPTR